MNSEYSIGKLCSIDPELRDRIRLLTQELMDGSDDERPGKIDQLLAIMKQNCHLNRKDSRLHIFCGLIMEALLVYLIRIKSTSESGYYKFLTLLNQLPISKESPFYQVLMQELNDEIGSNPDLLEVLNQLQVLYVLADSGDMEGARHLMRELEPKVNKDHYRFWTLLMISSSKILRSEEDFEGLIRSQLSILPEVYLQHGPESAIYFVLRWITNNNWERQGAVKKALLMRLYESFNDKRTLNNSLVLYDLFRMDDRIVPPAEKLIYQKKLIKFPSSILSIRQLQHLYFFAGNYNCGIQSKFKESIRYYQYSNYFLHKRWEILLNMSRFLRSNMTPEEYYRAMVYLEGRIHDLSEQVSLQNNAYVESLQAGYVKIEELYDKVEELALTDSLTGLRNRRYLDTNLQQLVAIAARHKEPLCYAMIDIDLFKRTNDTFGHQAGDHVLKELGKILTGKFRQSDIIIRYGGEEFLIVLFNMALDKCLELMEELREEVQSHSFVFRNDLIPITISVGVSYADHRDNKTSDSTKFIADSDAAMYQAKNTGRNRVVVCRSSKRGKPVF